MKTLIFFLLASHATTIAQVAIQLLPKASPPGPIKRYQPRSRSIENVVDWSQLRSTARRATERYGRNDPQTLLAKPADSRRWIATTSLPDTLRRVADSPDHETQKNLKNGRLPANLVSSKFRTASTHIEQFPTSDVIGKDPGDLSKGAAFAKLGMLKGSRYIRLRVASSSSKLHSRTRLAQAKNSTAPHEDPHVAPTSKHSRHFKSHQKLASKIRTASAQRSAYPSSELSGTILRDSVSGAGDIEFYGQIEVGTPPQAFMIDFDTGSSDMWIKDKTCKKNCGRDSTHKHAFYDSEKSSTSKDLASPFQISYGVGGVSGALFEDTVSVSGYNVFQQAFGVCDVLSEDWPNDPADGVLGLAFESIATSHKKPWFYNAISQNQKLNNTLESEMFSFAMGRYATQSHHKSELFLGGQNAEKYHGDFQWIPLTSKTYWQVELVNVYCNNGEDEKYRVEIPSTAAIIDSGTTYIAAPAEQARIFWENIPNSQTKSGDGFYTFPCSQSVKMVFDFGNGIELGVNELDLNLGKVSPGSDRCVGAVFGSQTGGNWILGISFMKSYYTTFDFGSSRLGFANRLTTDRCRTILSILQP
ncbi:uncharacterized protein PGTG_13934 [Puccinia graminis f. sp. tritici CRL 75-36-700-3]|uniref:Peptidase A1 domain-containing protein n=1 Tax=Puccinia graminis f. sp. tritici (strain CRL 75-36-700-3 / race SCCL) TaxID=418459 RepID=E3KTD8_PUCGT|nr:uncharacterized protein PGTG_13934 [Puccinia graminis f. sp. tritici CRL 75-36-700-3]EFP87563.2 hypothetical protein PGTG_13934 [Puccinia graminis f. sp. tritici CRL 75-36-700-3]